MLTSEKLDKANVLAEQMRSLSGLAHALRHARQCIEDNHDCLKAGRDHVFKRSEHARAMMGNLAGDIEAMVQDIQSERDDLMIALDKEARGR